MGKALKKLESEHNENLFSSTSLKVQSTYTQELVIALCGPIGSPLPKVGEELKRILENRLGYECKVIKLSKIIEQRAGTADKSSAFNRVQDLINKGDELRKRHGNSILADLAIAEIAYGREKDKLLTVDKKIESRRICHIIDSIKNQEELEALKSVYRDMLYFVGIFSPLLIREQNLKSKGMALAEVYQLIDRDSGEEMANGQTVRETFPLSDFFLRVDSGSVPQLKIKLDRFLNIIFGIEIPTPSVDETAMYLAAAAAANSACLSRQVGASITNKDGEVIAVGWNDVPKAGGNLYQYSPSDPISGNDKRCLHMDGGVCFNHKEKEEITQEIAIELEKKGLISKNDQTKVMKVIKESKIKNLIEFSRSIHAEMHAIIIGSQIAGDTVRGGKLYCTTYPCHSCARHIIAAGINEVYYIEPYRKSLAIKLHSDAITETESETKKVRILSFDGVAPSRYLKLFTMKPDTRKESDGKKKYIDPKKALPLDEVTLASLPALEGIVVKNLTDAKIIEATIQ